MTGFYCLLGGFIAQAGRFRRDENGAMAMTMGLMAIPLIFSVGAGIDYGSANMVKSKLDAIADTAALSAVDHLAISGSASDAQNTAQNTFNGQATDINNLSISNVSASVIDSATARTAVVNYTATKSNLFMSIFGIPTMTISGSSTAQAGLTTNINFYLLLDNSPSMNIAATSAGITTMVNNTQAQGGCAFACHESNPSTDNLGNAGGVDNYTLAQKLGVVTRMQNLAGATQSLMSTASSTEGPNSQRYQMAIYTFADSGLSTIQSLTSNLQTAQTAAGSINVMEVYSNNYLTKTNNNNDTDTNFETAMSQVNGIMPSPGTGTPSSTPQEVLFIVSDGVDDEVSSSCSQSLDGNRCQAPFNTAMCTTVKNRGIQIAVIYTAYLPLPTNSWYNSWIAPFQNQISPNLQKCASPNMFFTVTTDGDISAAMQTLFQQAVAAARLTK
ncbi:MAG TPA: TadE/TadG family type IV pilus assembly protein [Xanthobacteraceae bacterium]|jgi:Flp pilus assembly protein TadG|nr:TadE/TadG family type IV pilus assembly protein [Xanthobacteraceae bacterium]